MNTLTVAELIEQLQEMNPESPVYFTYNYGDYWRTKVAGSIKRVTEDKIEYSSYHSMMKVCKEIDDEDENQIDVVIIE